MEYLNEDNWICGFGDEEKGLGWKQIYENDEYSGTAEARCWRSVPTGECAP